MHVSATQPFAALEQPHVCRGLRQATLTFLPAHATIAVCVDAIQDCIGEGGQFCQ